MKPTSFCAVSGSALLAAILSVLIYVAPAVARDAPPGSYLQSCTVTAVRGTSVTASCTTRHGRRLESTLKAVDDCVGDISNNDGLLTCRKAHAPPGSYLEQCININVVGSTLTAYCRTTHGTLHKSTLDRFDLCVGDISNRGGNLICDKAGRGPPPGSYIETCEGVTLSGTTLTARCWVHWPKRDQLTTSLAQIDHCVGDISNYSGYLTCRKNNVPAGSYLNSCIQTSYADGVLSATCRGRDGSLRRTVLRRADQCRGDIRNEDGHLACDNIASRDLPPGSYQQSCINATLEGTTLTADCRTRNGQYGRSRLEQVDQCRGDIRNQDGHLACDNFAALGLPSGSYQQSCNNVTLEGTTLAADCRKRNGQYGLSRLEQIDQCRGDISNREGNLACDKRNAPPGSYKETCVVISVTRTTLTARCRFVQDPKFGKKGVGWNYTDLKQYDRCSGDIANIGGGLRCR
jgi:hypothetical protein